MKRVNRTLGKTLFLAVAGLLPAVPSPASPACGAAPRGAQDSPSSVAFLVYDAGETLALLPVADRLEELGFVVDWMPLTPWTADLLQESGQEHLALPEGVEAMPHVQDRHGLPETGYWEDHLARDPPDLAVLGMVSAVQGRLAAGIRAMGIPTRGYVDGFQLPGPEAISVRLARGWPEGESGAFGEIWVATGRVRDGFQALGIPTRVAGQPTLESWRRGAEEVDPATIRRIQGLAPGDRVLLWAGQYGDGYAETLDRFLQVLRPVLASDSTLVLVLSHHPRTHGEVEAAALQRLASASRGGAAAPPRAVMMSDGLTTMEMATASEVVLTWTSTVATQAAFMGKQAVYFSPPEGFDLHLVEEGGALLAEGADLPGMLRGRLDHPRSSEAVRRALLEAGYVVDADRRMAEMIAGAVAGAAPAGPPTPGFPDSEPRGR